MPKQDIQELTKRYSGNVAKLLTLGRPIVNPRKELSYTEDLGIDASDTEQLMQLADDMAIYHYVFGDVTDDEAPEFFGVIHAWKALSELGAPEAKAYFIERFEAYDFDDPDEWIIGEIRPLIAPYRYDMYENIIKYVENDNHSEWVRMEYLEIVKDMIEAKEVELSEVNLFLAKLLQVCDDPIVNSGAISLCMDFQLIEHHALIKKCFERKAVDIDHIGDLEEVEIEMGLRTERETEKELTEMQKQWQAVMQSVDEIPDYDEPTSMPFVNAEEKVGRNDPCPCGSGKKYKKCCMHK